MKILIFTLIPSLFLNFSHAGEEPPIEEYPAVILGSGVAAYTAATYLGRAGVQPLVVTGPYLGGMLALTPSVQNWPGEFEISGLALTDRLQKQAVANGAILYPGVVVHVDFSKRPFTLTTQDLFRNQKRTLKAESCIITSGAMFNLLNVPGELEYLTRGVSSCAVCDGPFYKDKVVGIVGGGDSALTEALYLSNIAKKVYIFVRKDNFRTVEKKRKQEVLAKSNIEVRFNTTIASILGDGQKVTHASLLPNKEELPLDALFLAIGSKPNTEIFRGQLAMDEQGLIALNNIQETSIPGIYAAGDVVDPRFKQAITAAGDAAKAALQLQESLSEKAQKKGGGPLALPVIRELRSTTELEKALKATQKQTFVYFSATYCPPCRLVSLLYSDWARKYSDRIDFLKVVVDDDPSLLTAYPLTGVPTLLIYDEQKKLTRLRVGLEGFAEVEELLKSVDAQTFVR